MRTAGRGAGAPTPPEEAGDGAPAGPNSSATLLRQRVHARLLAEVEPGGSIARELVVDTVRVEAPLLAPLAASALVDEVLADVHGLGPLDPVLAMPGVTDVMVNGGGNVWIERHGSLERLDLVLETRTVEHLIERVVSPLGRRVDRSSPLVDARLPDGSRVNVVLPPLAVDGPCLTIRRFAAHVVPVEEFCSSSVARLLRWTVDARWNVLVSGGTGSGKTTLLNALAAEIPAGERVVTIEDAAELRLPQDHVVRLEARSANAEGVGEVRIRDLVRNALRMRPDRIVVGEVRGAEALDMLQAMNTGHEGSLCTLHANGPADALRRLETMVLMAGLDLPLAAVRDQVHSAIDIVIQLRREGSQRRVCEVAEVAPPGASGEQLRPLAKGGRRSGTVSRPARSSDGRGRGRGPALRRPGVGVPGRA